MTQLGREELIDKGLDRVQFFPPGGRKLLGFGMDEARSRERLEIKSRG